MFLKPHGKIDLRHRAYLELRGAPFRSVVVAAAEDGQLSLLSPDLQEVQVRRLPSKVRAVSPHPSDRRLAWVGGEVGSLNVQDFHGSRLLEMASPEVRQTTPAWIQRGFSDCFYGEDGRFLWTIAPLDSEDVVVQLHEAESGATIETAAVKDPFGGSSCSFHPTARPDLTSLWLAAGQDGQQVYWLRRTRSGFSCTPEPKLKNTTPPVFSPGGKHVLVVNEDNAICGYDFPTMRQVGSPLESGDEDNPFAGSLCYLDERQALAGTEEGRVFAVDTVRMKLGEEVAVEGHEPRPIGEYYPTLAHERGLATDIGHFLRLGDAVVFVYRRDRGTGPVGWKDTLLWLSLKGRE